MKARHLNIKASLLLSFILFIIVFSVTSPLTSALEITVTTDKSSYVTGETLSVSGKTNPRSIVSVQVFNPDGVGRGMGQTRAETDGTWAISNIYRFSEADKPGNWTVKAYMGVLTAEAGFLLVEKPIPSAPTPTILITYSAYTVDVIGQYDAGDGETFLVINVTVENKGYSEFDLYLFKFLVKNQDMQYNSTYVGVEGELRPTLLKDGNKINGLLVFQVPQSLVDYELVYEVSEWEAGNIQYVNNTEYPIRERGEISIAHSGYMTNEIGLDVPKKGKAFLVVNISVTNHEYFEVNIWPQNLKVLINGKAYEKDPASLQLKDILESTKLTSGESVAGSLAFEVPEDTENYDLMFETDYRYNVECIKLTPNITEKIVNKAVITYFLSRARSLSTYTPDSGNVFIVTNITVENEGYQKFSVDPYQFKIETTNALYDIVQLLGALDGELQSSEMVDGEVVNGLLVFQMPESVTSYRLSYHVSEDYNIEYVGLPTPAPTYTPTPTPTFTKTPTTTTSPEPSIIPEFLSALPLEAVYGIIAALVAAGLILAFRRRKTR